MLDDDNLGKFGSIAPHLNVYLATYSSGLDLMFYLSFIVIPSIKKWLHGPENLSLKYANTVDSALLLGNSAYYK